MEIYAGRYFCDRSFPHFDGDRCDAVSFFRLECRVTGSSAWQYRAGGRQLDGAPSSIRALPAIVDAVGDKIEVQMDGGIRTGQDIIKAIALGAKGVYIGRPFLYGLGAMGEAGVAKCLDILRNELDLTMAFCGLTDIKKVDRKILLPGSY